MVKEKKIMGNTISRKFETMMPLDVFANFTTFAKANAGTGLGKFDFSVALRILLERNTYYEVVSELQEDILDLQSQINGLRSEISNKLNKEVESKDVNKNRDVKTFGK